MVAAFSIVTAAPALAAAPDSVTVTTTTTRAGQSSGYTVAIDTSATGGLAVGGDINITFPSGTTVPDSIYYQNVTVSSGGSSANVASGNIGVDGRTVTLKTPVAVAAGGTVSVIFSQVAGIKNPKIASHAADNTSYKVSASTASDTTPKTSAAYNITAWISASTMQLAYQSSTTVTGAGFKPGFEVNLAQTGGAAGMGPVEVDEDGTFSTVGFGTGIANVITATDGSGRTASTSTAVVVLPRMSLTPSSGNVGSNVVIKVLDISGTPTAIQLSGANWVTPATTPALPTTKTDVDADGAQDDVQVVAAIPPGTAAGSKAITFTHSGSGTAVATLTVASKAIVLDPGSGPPGATVMCSGAGFKPNTTYATGIMLILNPPAGMTAINTASIQTDGSGAFVVPCQIPATVTPGGYAVAAVLTDPVTLAQDTAASLFTVTATSLQIQPASGPYGTRFTISGGSNMVGTAGTIYVNGIALASPTPTITQPAGVMTPATITATGVAPYSLGTNNVQVKSATAAGTTTAAATFEILRPTCTVNVDEVARGGSVIFEGEGWLPGQSGMVSITLTYNVSAVATTRVAYATPNTDGSIYATMAIPSNADANQTATFAAADPASIGNTSLTGTLKISQGKITLDPESGPIGTVVTVSGVGFPPQQGITSLTMNNIPVILGLSVLTDPSGAFETQFTVPGFEASGYPVTATISGETASAAFQVTPGGETLTTPATAFSTISDCIVIAWTFDAGTQGWQKYDPTPGATSDMTSMVALQGYWIQVAEDCTLTYANNTWNLKAGWNLIGWPS
jgi:hypothetical protein